MQQAIAPGAMQAGFSDDVWFADARWRRRNHDGGAGPRQAVTRHGEIDTLQRLRKSAATGLLAWMDRLSPTPTAELVPAGSAGGSAVRSTAYALLALALAAGGWVRFNDRIADVAPWLAAPAQQTAEQVAQTRNAAPIASVRELVELKVLPRDAEAAAVAGLGLTGDQAGQLRAGLKSDQLRLVQLPLFDAGALTADGSDAGRDVMVSTAGFSRLVRLGRQPVVVTLPINRVGTVSFRTTAAAAGQPVEIGAITMNGPMRLPAIMRGDELDVGVAAE